MRFLHTADWHIGKKLHDFRLLKIRPRRLIRLNSWLKTIKSMPLSLPVICMIGA